MPSAARLGRFWLAAAVCFVTPAAAQLQPAVVRGPYLQSPTPTSVVVRWRTAGPTDSRVRYGTAPDNLNLVALAPGLTTEHQVLLEGLEPATRYFYAVGSSLGDFSSGPDHNFVTAPLPGARQPVRIWAFGDSGQGTEAQANVRDAYLSFTGARGTDVWMLLGDNAYLIGSDADYQLKFFDYYAPVLRQVPAWSTFGNHENFTASSNDESGPYYELFTFPELGEAGGVPSAREAYYSFNYANIHFICLNSQDVDRAPGSAMLAWLEQDLAVNQQEWTIAFFHHPVYSGGTHDSDTDTGMGVTPPSPADDFAIQQMRENVLPLLEAGGVDLVLTGHSHNYERTVLLDGHYGTSDTLTASMKLDPGDGRIDGAGPYRKTGDIFGDAHSGTVYAVVGTGSEAFEVNRVHPAMTATAGVPGALVIDIDGPRLDAQFLDQNGDRLDSFTILRGAGFNFAPIARDDAASTAPLSPVVVAVLANDSDPDDDLLLVEAVGEPARGTAVDNGDGTVTYTPEPGFSDGIDSFGYTVGDGHGHSASATVIITVACPPLADGLFFDDLEPVPEPGWTVETAVNNNPLSATWAAVEDPAARSPIHSWFSESSDTTFDKDDRLQSPPLDLSTASRLVFWHRYNFEPGFDGGVLEISTDGGAHWTDLGPFISAGGYGPATIPIEGENRGAWTGVGSESMTQVVVELGSFAGADRIVRWRLIADFITLDETFGWLVDDVELSALVSGPGDCNQPPIAADDSASTTTATAVEIDVLANDFDPDGDPIAVSAVGAPGHGSAAPGPAGRILYQPEPGFTGTDAFLYEVTDGELVDSATVSVMVTEAPLEPSRARGNGEIHDSAGPARFALHARIEDGAASGWLRYRTLSSEGSIDLEGSVGAVGFTAPERAELEGVCWFDDGRPCRFRATVEDRGHPGAGADRFGIAVRDPQGELIYAAESEVDKGQVKID